LEAAWHESARLAALQPPRRKSGLKSLLGSRTFKAAAVLAVLGVVGALSYRIYVTPSVTTYATAIGGRRTLTLPDGTTIELNTNSVVQIADDLTERKVWLVKGEAYFQVNHDPLHPFTVYARDHKITDLGTKFIVRQSGDRVEVALLEGRAQFETIGAGNAPQSTELSPGEIAFATGDSMSVTTKPVSAMANDISWRKGILVFDDTTLGEAVAEFNRYNAEKIVLRNPSLAKLRVNGTFPVHARHEFAEVARAVFGLRAESKGDQIEISR
jgi:transmembrane sensor